MGRRTREIEGQQAFELTWEPRAPRPAPPPPPTGNHKKALENIEALRLARRLEDEERPPTPDEERVLARFTPWSALPEVFDPDATAPWLGAVRDELEGLLTGDELDGVLGLG